ncbi:MAG: aminoacyl-tRNA hydrolase [Bacillota bacterium]|uniref:aminoacyl-tRNA hydrolase n=1 Tax=Virgibacillus TaxID=84406 RepID=UPI00040C460C|nr:MULTISPECIES: aminoacyl-tRNA hydrolase [Bacillaceae]MCC2250594.1 aminoacyl-tRNA hydrolase [Virgibacillus sp. AGTR]MDY7045111.1 aminoacyl-tRNA hydrolase [Virgibacillus sp. M23]QRZ19094.1 aminoacyl-tRNA hydrolase [Virgibacillus sp. AGTR]WBX81221.1 aminoacyl-tRNA hydrolase [Virgibacillus salarius]
MKCIIGLGNPGKKYNGTRHNVGFMVIDELLHRHSWKLNKSKYKGDYTIVHLDGEKVLLLEPQTFMNLSGDAVRPLMDYYDIKLEDILIIYDDLDLPVGKIRLRQKGGHGGHNGIRSIIDHLGTKDFKRIRIGVGRPTSSVSVVDYVLSNFSKGESEAVSDSIGRAADACEAWLSASFSQVMNEYNQ